MLTIIYVHIYDRNLDIFRILGAKKNTTFRELYLPPSLCLTMTGKSLVC